MKANGKMIRQKVSESIHITTVTDTLEIGRRINSMEKVLKSGLMIHNMMVITSLE